MNLKKLLTITLLLVCSFQSMAQKKEYEIDILQQLKEHESRLLEDKFNDLHRDQYTDIDQLKDLRTEFGASSKFERFIPINMEDHDLVKLILGTSLGILMIDHDRDMMDIVQDGKTSRSEFVANIGTNFAELPGMAAVSVGSYFLGVVLKDGKLKKMGIYTVGSLLATGVVVQAIKYGVGRKRPYKSEDPMDFFNFKHRSFPSGHTAAAFSLATMITEMYGDKHKVVPYISYGLAALSAYARVHDQKHWVSDVIVGAVLGHLVTKYFLKFIQKDWDFEKSGISLYPYLGMNGDFGIGFEVKF